VKALPVAMLLALSAACVAAPKIDESRARPGEWGFRPGAGTVCEIDPPAFCWRPVMKAKGYEVRVERDGTAEPLFVATGLRLPAHRPPSTFGPGSYSWRVRVPGGAWSSARPFTIPEGATAFPLPARAEILGRIPEGHPRIFFRASDLPRLRELSTGRLADVWKKIVRKCEKMLAKPIDVSEPLTYRVDEVRGVNDDAWRKRWWGNRKRVIEVVDGAARLGSAWRISGDERFAKEGRRLLLAACGWNPKGATWASCTRLCRRSSPERTAPVRARSRSVEPAWRCCTGISRIASTTSSSC